MKRDELLKILNERYSRGITNEETADRILEALEKEREGEVVLYSGMCKAGEPDFVVKNGRGDNESVVLVPVPYKVIKGKRGSIILRPEDK